MTVKDIISGESEYIEFKQEVPKKSEVYMKTVVWRMVHLKCWESTRKMLSP